MSTFTLEDFLECNYKKLQQRLLPTDGPKMVFEYYDHTESVLNEEPRFIKFLTKVASHLFKEYPFMMTISRLEKQFIFCLEGAYLLHKQGTSDTNFHRMEIHLHGHAGNAADNLFIVTKDLDWAEQAYKEHLFITKRSIGDEPEYAFVNSCKAMRNANTLMERDMEKWGTETYKFFTQALKILKESDDTIFEKKERKIAELYSFGAAIAFSMRRVRVSDKWIERNYLCLLQTGRYYEESGERNLAHTNYEKAERIATSLSGRRQSTTWKRRQRTAQAAIRNLR